MKKTIFILAIITMVYIFFHYLNKNTNDLTISDNNKCFFTKDYIKFSDEFIKGLEKWIPTLINYSWNQEANSVIYNYPNGLSYELIRQGCDIIETSLILKFIADEDEVIDIGSIGSILIFLASITELFDDMALERAFYDNQFWIEQHGNKWNLHFTNDILIRNNYKVYWQIDTKEIKIVLSTYSPWQIKTIGRYTY